MNSKAPDGENRNRPIDYEGQVPAERTGWRRFIHYEPIRPGGWKRALQIMLILLAVLLLGMGLCSVVTLYSWTVHGVH